MPTPLLAELRAYLGYARSEDAQMPDPLGYADFQWLAGLDHSHGELILPGLERAYFANPVGSRWGMRKKDRSLRWMTTVNPFAELRVRLTLHPHSEALYAAQTDHAISNSYDLVRDVKNGYAVLRRRSFGRTHRRLRKQLSELRSKGYAHGFKTDITDFYPSVRPTQVATAIARCAGSDAGTEISLVLERFELETGIPGLPVGAECSSLFSNLALGPVDCAMDGVPNIEWLRWTDDFLVLDGEPPIVDGAHARLVDALRAQGLSLASAKTRSTTDGSELTVDDLIDGFTGSQGDLQDLKQTSQSDPEIVRFAEQNLITLIEGSYRDTSRLNRLLGYLAAAPPDLQPLRAHIVSIFIQTPEIWEMNAPRSVKYLAHNATSRQWLELIDLARNLAPEQPVSDGQVAHICSAVATHPSRINAPEPVSELMLGIFQRAEAAIVRGWSLRAAALLAPDRVLRWLFNARGFDHLSSLEQRWAIGLANLPDHRTFLEEQARSGKWPLTASWRLATCR